MLSHFYLQVIQLFVHQCQFKQDIFFLKQSRLQEILYEAITFM